MSVMWSVLAGVVIGAGLGIWLGMRMSQPRTHKAKNHDFI
jgi:uncharacterized membrane protein YfcA